MEWVSSKMLVSKKNEVYIKLKDVEPSVAAELPGDPLAEALHHSHSGGWLAGCGRNGFVRSLSSRRCVARDFIVSTPQRIHHGRLALRQGCLHRSLKS